MATAPDFDPTLSTYIPFEYVTRLVSTHPSKTTLNRWVRKGLNGVRLQYIKIGSKRVTTHQWLEDFFVGVTQAAAGLPACPSASAAEAAEAAEAEAARQRLRENGVVPQ